MRVMRYHSSAARGRTKAGSAEKHGRLFWTSGCPPENLCFSLTNAEMKCIVESVGRKHDTSLRGKYTYGSHVCLEKKYTQRRRRNEERNSKSGIATAKRRALEQPPPPTKAVVRSQTMTREGDSDRNDRKSAVSFAYPLLLHPLPLYWNATR